jgi:hypothetical protein
MPEYSPRGMKYLLDTNVLRELGKTSPHRNVAAWLKAVDDGDLAISALRPRDHERRQQAEKDEARDRGCAEGGRHGDLRCLRETHPARRQVRCRGMA